ncbi:hypothetical protein BCIN_02g07480 [Botrytis cinerea B05.10]|uniref:Prolyl 4-hydroxylase alpha subunit domain-containing protein n=1 Tax=Botryotinia fuckeliana (strain B05.10) TaxID=332648 RepID=A0A384JAJ1_BOTFB|nr:hypothetical protein BCIN_02g07480 [Botrytis cinerea B05.10]ATZ47472.1 hypothetical protein BCIN_02g07480 [Botrytis cinerea B05.10]
MDLKQIFYTSFIVALLAAAFSAVPRSITVPSFFARNSCPQPRYIVRTLSYDPLIQHIENFITSQEADHLLKIAKSKFRPSRAVRTDGQAVATHERTSSTAYLPSDDPVVQCIRSRASEYQGYVDLEMMESLQVTRYLEGQQYTNHYDWATDPAARNQTTNRETTFFAVLDVECSSCGTRFPKISVDWAIEDQRWCNFVDCKAIHELTVRGVVGSAVFWRNLHSNGTGDTRTLHAGLPALGGRKVGLNIWTRREV